MNFSSNPSPKPTPNILVVDDSTDSRFLVEIILQEAGYQIQSAENGYSALARIEEFPPDLMVLDLMMPGINGYEVIQALRDGDRFPHIPVLIMTACHRLEWIEEAHVKADGLIHKPIDVDDLLAQVETLLEKVNAGGSDRDGYGSSPTPLSHSFDVENRKKKVAENQYQFDNGTSTKQSVRSLKISS